MTANFTCTDPVALDKDEGVVKAQIACAERE